MGRGVKKGGERDTGQEHKERGKGGQRAERGQTDPYIASPAYLVVAR